MLVKERPSVVEDCLTTKSLTAVFTVVLERGIFQLVEAVLEPRGCERAWSAGVFKQEHVRIDCFWGYCPKVSHYRLPLLGCRQGASPHRLMDRRLKLKA